MSAWRVEFFNENVAAEVNGLPTDIRAKFLHIAEMMIAVGPQRMREPHVKPLRDKLWEMRMSGKDGIGRAIYILASYSWSCTPSSRRRKKLRRRLFNSPF